MSLKKLGRYEVIRVLGRGAMGVVYEGRDPNLDRRVAIKTVKVENLTQDAAAEYEVRFRTEARSAARLQHPNIVSVYDSDRDGDTAFLVMEFIQGDDLKHHLDRGIRYTLEQSLKMIRDLLAALDYAHKQGIVHRDVKPANLLLEASGRVKLTDFGVARIQDSGEATRTQGSMVGTLKYMAPEQVQGQKIDARADLFSVGVVLYQLLTDKRPFDGDNDFSIIHQIIGHTPPPPSAFNGGLPPAIDAVVARALAKNRDDRFASARDFATALQSAMRRADDATVVPPADPHKRHDVAVTGSRGSRADSRSGSLAGAGSGTAGTAGTSATSASVTQELELVYWKDIKDSTEAEEFEGFLERFPAGIYADLARRRLRRLTAGEATLSREGVPVDDTDTEATRLLTPGETGAANTSLPSTALAPDTSASPPSPVIAHALDGAVAREGVDAAITITPPDRDERSQPDAAIAAPDPMTVAEPMNPGSETASAAARGPDHAPAGAPMARKPALAWMAGGGAVVVALLGAVLLGRGDRSDPTPGESAQPLSAASAPVVTQPAASAPGPAAAGAPAQSRPAPAAAVNRQPAQTAVGAARASASAPAEPRTGATTSRPADAPAAATTAVPSSPVAPQPSREREEAARPVTPPPTTRASSPVVQPAQASAAYNAVEQCRAKFIFAREFCLAENCDKEGARSHPLCVEYRAQVRMREDIQRQEPR